MSRRPVLAPFNALDIVRHEREQSAIRGDGNDRKVLCQHRIGAHRPGVSVGTALLFIMFPGFRVGPEKGVHDSGSLVARIERTGTSFDMPLRGVER